MKRNISDLLDGYLAEDMELGGVPPYSPSRIKEITMNHIMNTEHNDQPKTKARAGRRPMRLLIAAAVIAAFSVSALAAGRRGSWTPLTSWSSPLRRRTARSPPPSPAMGPPSPP